MKITVATQLFPWLLLLQVASTASTADATLLEGELPIDLGRELVIPDRFPTITDLRQQLGARALTPVLLFRLFGSDLDHFVPTWSADGRQIAFQGTDPKRQASRLFHWSAETRQVGALLAESPTYDTAITFSKGRPGAVGFLSLDRRAQHAVLRYQQSTPDFQELFSMDAFRFGLDLRRSLDDSYHLTYDDARNLHLLTLDASGQRAARTRIPEAGLGRFSPDGSRLCYLKRRRRGRKVVLYDVVVHERRTQEETILYAGQDRVVRALRWSPDGKHIAGFTRSTSAQERWTLVVMSLESGSPVRTMCDNVPVNPDFETAGPAWSGDGQSLWYLEAADRESGAVIARIGLSLGAERVPIAKQLHRPTDLTLNPRARLPELCFAAAQQSTTEMYVVFLSRN